MSDFNRKWPYMNLRCCLWRKFVRGIGMRAQNRMLILRIMAAGLLIGSALFVVAPAAADDERTCNLLDKADIVIAACTRAIASGQYIAQNLATLYISRAIAAFRGNGQNDRARQDFDQATQLDPQFAQADRTDPVDVGDGQFIICCRAIVYDCRTHIAFRLRDTPGRAAEQCIDTCAKNAICH